MLHSVTRGRKEWGKGRKQEAEQKLHNISLTIFKKNWKKAASKLIQTRIN